MGPQRSSDGHIDGLSHREGQRSKLVTHKIPPQWHGRRDSTIRESVGFWNMCLDGRVVGDNRKIRMLILTKSHSFIGVRSLVSSARQNSVQA